MMTSSDSLVERVDKIKYEEGGYYGLNNDILLKEKLPDRYGIFVCPICQNTFKSIRSQVRKRVACKSCTNDLKLKVHVGDVFTRLTVLEVLPEKNKDNRRICKVICSCERQNIFYTDTHKLLTGNTKSCGCLQRESVVAKNKAGALDITGRRFGRLTAIKDTGVPSSNGHIWLFDCDCGNKNIPIRLGDVHRRTRVGTLSCGCLKQSKGEYLIEQALKRLSVKYIKEKSFEDCLNPKTSQHLYFDFYLPELNACIEFDGIQHFAQSEYDNRFWWGSVNLKEIQYRDFIKDTYCSKNNISLFRIPYRDINKLSPEYLERIIRGI